MNKSKLLWLAIALLLALNVSTIATVFYSRSVRANRPVNVRLSSERGVIDNDFLKDELGFDSEQLKAAKPALSEFRKSASTLVSELNNQKRQLFKVVTANNPDLAKVDSLANATGETHSKIKIATTNFYFSLKAICNNAQIEKLTEAFTPMLNGPDNMNIGKNPNGGNAREGAGNRPRPNRGETHRGGPNQQ